MTGDGSWNGVRAGRLGLSRPCRGAGGGRGGGEGRRGRSQSGAQPSVGSIREMPARAAMTGVGQSATLDEERGASWIQVVARSPNLPGTGVGKRRGRLGSNSAAPWGCWESFLTIRGRSPGRALAGGIGRQEARGGRSIELAWRTGRTIRRRWVSCVGRQAIGSGPSVPRHQSEESSTRTLDGASEGKDERSEQPGPEQGESPRGDRGAGAAADSAREPRCRRSARLESHSRSSAEWARWLQAACASAEKKPSTASDARSVRAERIAGLLGVEKVMWSEIARLREWKSSLS
jgi:hypothetical protein